MLEPTHPETLSSLGRLSLAWEAEGRWSEAEEAYREALAGWRRRSGPEDSRTLTPTEGLVRVPVAQKRFREAALFLDETLTPALVGRPEGANLLGLRAERRARANRWTDAAVDAVRAFELQPAQSGRYAVVAALLLKSGDLKAYERLRQRRAVVPTGEAAISPASRPAARATTPTCSTRAALAGSTNCVWIMTPIRCSFHRPTEPVAATMSEATTMLAVLDAGEPASVAQLLEIVYDELRCLGASKLAREAPGHTLQPTALVHEAWLRLAGPRNPTFKNRTHIFRAAGEAMRRILIDRARRRRTQRHEGGLARLELEEFDLAAPDADDQLLAVHDALDKLARDYPVQAELVTLRYFAGMTNEEAAQVLGISVSSAKN